MYEYLKKSSVVAEETNENKEIGPPNNQRKRRKFRFSQTKDKTDNKKINDTK